MVYVPISWTFLTERSCHVTYAIQSESTLYSCLNVKELLAWSRCEIWSLSDCNWTRTHNQLVQKWTLNHLTKLGQFTACPSGWKSCCSNKALSICGNRDCFSSGNAVTICDVGDIGLLDDWLTWSGLLFLLTGCNHLWWFLLFGCYHI